MFFLLIKNADFSIVNRETWIFRLLVSTMVRRKNNRWLAGHHSFSETIILGNEMRLSSQWYNFESEWGDKCSTGQNKMSHHYLSVISAPWGTLILSNEHPTWKAAPLIKILYNYPRRRRCTDPKLHYWATRLLHLKIMLSSLKTKAKVEYGAFSQKSSVKFPVPKHYI